MATNSGVLLNEEEVSAILDRRCPPSAAKFLLVMKMSGGCVGGYKGLYNSDGRMTRWEIRAAADYFERLGLLKREIVTGKSVSMTLKSSYEGPSQGLAGVGGGWRGLAVYFPSDENLINNCPISASDIKERKVTQKKENVDSESYIVNSASVVSTSQNIKQLGPSVNFTSDSKSESSVKYDISPFLQNHFTEHKKSCQAEHAIIAKKAIEHLNSKTGRNFRSEGKMSDANKKPIIARINEGATERNLISVIDHQVKEWIGTDMEEYLTPQTLFRPGNFAKYLAASEHAEKRKMTMDEMCEYVKKEHEIRGKDMTEEEWHEEEEKLFKLWRDGKL